MRYSTLAAALLPLASAELYTKEEYRSGAVMAAMMEAKEVLTTSNPGVFSRADHNSLLGRSTGLPAHTGAKDSMASTRRRRVIVFDA